MLPRPKLECSQAQDYSVNKTKTRVSAIEQRPRLTPFRHAMVGCHDVGRAVIIAVKLLYHVHNGADTVVH